MPDRFADGEPSNNNPPGARHQADRTKPRGHHGGDLEGIIQHLPYLQEIGITAIWTTPIYKNLVESSYHGYWILDHYAVEPHLGDIQTLARFADEAHRLGIKIVQDQIANHIGPGHRWVDHPPTTTWLNGTRENHLANDFNVSVLADPHGTAYARRIPLEGWFANTLPDLNQQDQQLQTYLVQNTLWWIYRSGIDGIRQDTYPYVPRPFWSRWHTAIKTVFPRLSVVGEVWSMSSDVVAFFQGGHRGFDGIDTGLYSAMDFPLFAAMRSVLGQDGKMPALADVLGQDRLYPDPYKLTIFYGNHDVTRFATLAGGDLRRIKLAHAFLLTCGGIPQLYYGDEIGMEGSEDPHNRGDFPGGFPGDAHNVFDPAKRTQRELELLDHWKRWVGFRQRYPSLRRGVMHHLYVDDDRYVFLRSLAQERVIVALSKSDNAKEVKIPIGPELKGSSKIVSLLEGTRDSFAGDSLQLEIVPWKASIWVLE